jgi:sugar phosphate permease
MHGVNQMIICYTPTRFEPYGRVSTFSGLLNCFVYVGAAISTYGFAGFSEAFGWRNTMFMWTGLALLGTVFCLICIPKWRAFYQGRADV